MPSLKSIRIRIASVKNTQKITKAMKLVAAARLRRAQQRITELRPYAQKVTEVLGSVAARAGDGSAGTDATHPLLASRAEKRTAIVLVLTSDRGLAGAFNANAQRLAERRVRELSEEGFAEVQLVTIGRKGRDYFRRRGTPVLHDFTGAYEKAEQRAPEIARQLMDDFTQERADHVEVVFTEFKSAITQRVRAEPLLPVKIAGSAPPAADTGSTALATTARDEQAASANATGGRGDYIYEPDKTALLARLLPMYVETAVFRAMLDSLASEHGARMTAMDSATNNAKQLIKGLALKYNRARQAAITKELMEIIGGAEALKG